MTIAIARLKKPHKHFNAGDLVVGEIVDGMGEGLACWGWSSKHQRIVGGRHGYRLRYIDWKFPSRRYQLAAENAKLPYKPECVPIGCGHLRIIKWFQGKSILEENPPQLRDEAWLRWLLKELSCGNMPLSRLEATPSNCIYTVKIRSFQPCNPANS